METERCPWCLSGAIYMEYHDKEWGVPVREDHKQFEFLVLESAQAGLSWLTILKRRDGYRRLYGGFDAEKVAAYGENEIRSMLQDPGIIRNRRKIEASINNARKNITLTREIDTLKEEINHKYDFEHSITGVSPAMFKVFKRIE